MNIKKYENFIKQFKIKIDSQPKELLFLCIGTNKVIGDSFGPMVGSKLKNLNNDIDVLGNMEEPICAKNIKEKINEIIKYKEKKCIIAIDSAICNNKENVNQIFISNKGLILGSGINKNIFEIGDISIKGVVCNNFKMLENVPRKIINELATIVATGIYNVI